MGTCVTCGYRGTAVHPSVAARGAMLCLTCYGRLPESRAVLPPGWKPYERKPEKPRTPTRYALLWDKVWNRLNTLTQSPVFPSCDRTGRLASYCPVCRVTCITVQIVDGDTEPTVRADACENGCTAAEIARVLLK